MNKNYGVLKNNEVEASQLTIKEAREMQKEINRQGYGATIIKFISWGN